LKEFFDFFCQIVPLYYLMSGMGGMYWYTVFRIKPVSNQWVDIVNWIKTVSNRYINFVLIFVSKAYKVFLCICIILKKSPTIKIHRATLILDKSW